jgi:hypothetical protein
MAHVAKFTLQFRNIYGNRFLFFTPPNEFGVLKFLPTTIRPTHLPFRELYHYASCAQFVAGTPTQHLNVEIKDITQFRHCVSFS